MTRLNPAVIPCGIFLFGMFMMVSNAEIAMGARQWALVAAEALFGVLGLWMMTGATDRPRI